MAPQPTILIIHGAWHRPLHYQGLCDKFEQAGFPTSCPDYPSIGAQPPVGLYEDAQCIRDELKKLIEEEGKDVIVISHSYGGVIASQAVDAKFAKKQRSHNRKPGGVVHMLYMCAFLLPQKTSLAGGLGGTLPPWIVVDDQGMSHVDGPEKLFYNNLPEDEQKHWTSLLEKMPIIGQMTEQTQAAYLHHPVTYLYCEADAALPLPVQQMMVNNISTSTGIKVLTETCNGTHSPFLTVPERVVEVIQAIAAQ